MPRLLPPHAGAAGADAPARCGARWTQIREDLGRYAAAGVTQMFLEPNFQPGGADLERVLGQMEALAP